MAALTNVTSKFQWNSAGATSGDAFTTGSVTLEANTAYIGFLEWGEGATAPTLTSVTGATIIRQDQYNAAANGCALLRWVLGSQQASALTIQLSGPLTYGASLEIVELVGSPNLTSSGANLVTQTAINTGIGVTTLTATLGAFGDAGNSTMGFANLIASNTISAGSGFTGLTQYTARYSVPLLAQWRGDNDTTVDMSWSSGTALIYGLEIDEDAAGSTQPIRTYNSNRKRRV